MNQPLMSDLLAARLAELEEQAERGQPASDGTLAPLQAELNTVISELRRPADANPFEQEPACQKVTQMVQALGRDSQSEPERTIDNTGDTFQPRSSPTEHEPLAHLGAYELLSKLGEGGMGAVYKARHIKLDKIVAIKVLPAERMKDQQSVTRFEREMRAVGKLEHPHIVRAMDAGQADGVHYLAMEYVQGVDLSQLVKDCHPLAIADACELIRQAAVGLDEGHDNGMVHRDIKPSNLMLCSVGKKKPPIVKILDMGLALLSEAHSPEAQGLTTTGQMMGTLDYMAPEQGGDSKGVDIRADIYALGATLYKLLCGEAIYHGEKYQTPVQKMMALATQPAPPIQARRAGIPDELAVVLNRMVAKNPSERFATPAEVAEGLAPFCSGANLGALLNRASVDSPVSKDAVTQPSLSHPETNTSVGVLTRNLPAELAAQREYPVRRAANWKPVAIAASLAGVALAIAAAIVLYIPTAKGTLRVEIKDPSIEATIKGSNVVFKKGGIEEFNLTPGETSLIVKRGGLKFETNKFELEKNGEVVILVELLPGEIRVARQDGTSLGGSKLEGVSGGSSSPPSLAGAPSWRATPEQQQWLDSVAKLEPEELVKAISEKLVAENPEFDGKLHREFNGNVPVNSLIFDGTNVTRIWPLRAARDLKVLQISGPHGGGGKLADLSPLQGMKLTNLTCHWSSVKDISSLRGMPLVEFNTLGSAIRSLEPLRGMQLNSLNCYGAPISDVSPLQGMPLTRLGLDYTQVSDLRPLRRLPLTSLTLGGTSITELSALQGLKLQQLYVGKTRISDLTPLIGMPLTQLDCGYTEVTDLKPLAGMKLEMLFATTLAIRDLSVLKGMPLTRLEISSTHVSDLTPLRGLPLESLGLLNTRASDLGPLKEAPLSTLACNVPYYDPQVAILRSLPCTWINNELAADFWKKFNAKVSAAEKFAADSSKLTTPELETAIKSRLAETNPGKVVELFALSATERPEVRFFNRDSSPLTQFNDISALLAVPKLRKLALLGGAPWLDLSPLLKTEIEELTCTEVQALSNRTILAASESLKLINDQPAADYLRKLNGQLPSTP